MSRGCWRRLYTDERGGDPISNASLWARAMHAYLHKLADDEGVILLAKDREHAWTRIAIALRVEKAERKVARRAFEELLDIGVLGLENGRLMLVGFAEEQSPIQRKKKSTDGALTAPTERSHGADTAPSDHRKPAEQADLFCRQNREEENRRDNPIVPCEGTTDRAPSARRAKKRQPVVYSPAFLVFWADYPNRVNKGAAFVAFQDAAARSFGGDESRLALACSSALAWQRNSAQWREQGGRYIPHAATWLNDGGYESEPPQQPESIYQDLV